MRILILIIFNFFNNKKMFKYFPYITILFLFISTVSCENKSEQIPINNIWEHIKYQNKVGIDKLEKEYKILFDKNKKSPELYFLYSRCITDYTNKITILSNGLNKFPNNPLLLGSLGLAYFSGLNSDELGLFFCNKALKFDSKNLFALYGMILYNSKKIESSESLQQKLNLYLSLYYLYRNIEKIDHHEILIENIDLNKVLIENQKKVEIIKSKLNSCAGLTSKLRANEIDRIARISQMIISKLNVFYLGDCQYEVIGEAFDQLYGNFKEILIYYEFDGDKWNVIKEPKILKKDNINSDSAAPIAIDGEVNKNIFKGKNYDKIIIIKILNELEVSKNKMSTDEKKLIERYKSGNISDIDFKASYIRIKQMKEILRLREMNFRKQFDSVINSI